MYVHVHVGICRYLFFCSQWCIKSDAHAVLGLIAQKSTQQKRCKSQQNGFDCSGARTPVDWCTIGTMYHWASQADNMREMMEYIAHVSRYIPTYTYRYLYIHSYTCIYLHIHAYTCTYQTPPNLKGPYLSDQWADRPEPKNRFNNRPFPTNCAGFWHMKRIRHDMAA